MSYPPTILESTVATSDPAAEPVTLDQIKGHCRVDNDAEDPYLESLIVTAREFVESESERTLARRTFVTRFSRFPLSGSALILPRCPLISVTSVAYFDALNASQTLSPSLYTVRADTTPGTLEEAVGASWPATAVRGDAVTVTYVAGYGNASECPQIAQHAIRMLVGHWYENREAATAGVDVREVPMAVTRLLWLLRPGVMR